MAVYGKIRSDKIKFINLVKSHPCLYNTYLPEYAERTKINEAWSNISKQCGLPIEKCKISWKNIRRIYVRGLRPRFNGRFTPAPAYIQKHLEFVLPYIKTHIVEQSSPFNFDEQVYTTRNMQNVKSEEDDDGDIEDDDSELLEGSSRDKTFSDITDVENIMQPQIKIETHTPEPWPSTSGETDPSRKLFLLSLLPEIDAMTTSQYRLFRKKVLEAIDSTTNEIVVSSSGLTMTSTASPSNSLGVTWNEGSPQIQTCLSVKEESDIDYS